ncbi:hypothetical protein [Rhodanobacter sp. B04]|uniref:hypothetical protein n=1 Tax=Rhodanobacter sp. B04 TaxID=1945860 RepID=UPI0011157C00|nr:hypothetical protein [Rhodanobacter sp. B04]
MNDASHPSSRHLALARGQRMVMTAIAGYFIAVAVAVNVPRFSSIPFPVLGILLLLGFLGVLDICNGLEYKPLKKYLCLASMLLPFANVAIILVLNYKANRKLKHAGFHVGIFGATIIGAPKSSFKRTR